MTNKVAVATSGRHLNSLDIVKPRMAKASVNLVDNVPEIDWNAVVCKAISRAVRDVWDNDKEAAGEIGVDTAELCKWLNGTRRAQLDKLWAIERLRQPLCVRFCQLAGAEIHTRVEWPHERTA